MYTARPLAIDPSCCWGDAQSSRKGFEGTRCKTVAVPATVTGDRLSMLPLGGCLGRRGSSALAEFCCHLAAPFWRRFCCIKGSLGLRSSFWQSCSHYRPSRNHGNSGLGALVAHQSTARIATQSSSNTPNATEPPPFPAVLPINPVGCGELRRACVGRVRMRELTPARSPHDSRSQCWSRLHSGNTSVITSR